MPPPIISVVKLRVTAFVPPKICSSMGVIVIWAWLAPAGIVTEPQSIMLQTLS